MPPRGARAASTSGQRGPRNSADNHCPRGRPPLAPPTRPRSTPAPPPRYPQGRAFSAGRRRLPGGREAIKAAALAAELTSITHGRGIAVLEVGWPHRPLGEAHRRRGTYRRTGDAARYVPRPPRPGPTFRVVARRRGISPLPPVVACPTVSTDSGAVPHHTILRGGRPRVIVVGPPRKGGVRRPPSLLGDAPSGLCRGHLRRAASAARRTFTELRQAASCEARHASSSRRAWSTLFAINHRASAALRWTNAASSAAAATRRRAAVAAAAASASLSGADLLGRTPTEGYTPALNTFHPHLTWRAGAGAVLLPSTPRGGRRKVIAVGPPRAGGVRRTSCPLGAAPKRPPLPPSLPQPTRRCHRSRPSPSPPAGGRSPPAVGQQPQQPVLAPARLPGCAPSPPTGSSGARRTYALGRTLPPRPRLQTACPPQHPPRHR